jgi:hypothetical protein
MGFGKRPTTNVAMSSVPRATETGRDGRLRVIPAEMWEGELGDMLRTLGMSPDDESNLVPNQQSLEERLALGRAQLEAKLMRVNDDIARRTNGGSMRPFFLLPDPCWNGDMGHFLMMRLDLFPYDDWNVSFLPVDERTALKLDAPMHPNGNLPAFVKASEEFLTREEANLREAHAEAGRSQDFGAFGDARDQIRSRIKALAGFFHAELHKAWRHHHSPAPGRAN